MEGLGVGFILSLLLSALAQVQYASSFSGSFLYNIASPENTVYDVNTVPLDIYIRTTNGFRFGYDNYVTEIFYCLDGKENVTVPFEETITGEGTHYNYRVSTYLSSLSDGDHNVIVYGVGKKYPFVLDSIDFAIVYSSKTPEPTPTPTPAPTSAPTPSPVPTPEPSVTPYGEADVQNTSQYLASGGMVAVTVAVIAVGLGLLVYKIKRK